MIRAFSSLEGRDVSPADELATEILKIRRDVQQIDPLSRTRPHIFAEQKDALAKRLDGVATKLRVTFGGTPTRYRTGAIVSGKGRRVQVERRRAGVA